MTTPSSGHSIRIEPNPKRVIVWFNGQTIADSTHALTLYEGSMRPVIYIPRAEVDMRLLTRAAHVTYCPFKGHASYFSIHAGARHAVHAVWTYEEPLATVEPIRDHLAFYENLVDQIEELLQSAHDPRPPLIPSRQS